ncbi:MAG: glycine cleavage system aminomethyltransferase GcvT [Opitutaceae bacterium]|nr:glycine cleavage system aminomethyltransferase GcvT [Opitutaceae bacterium]
MSSLRRTCLHEFNAARGARFVDFAGWEMPVQYKSILDEHRAVRAAAGLFDVSHMGEITVRGRGAGAFIDRLVTNDISRLTPGGVVYSPMCHPGGGVVDDLLVYMRAPEDYLLCVNASNTAKDHDWIRRNAGDFSGEIEDQSAQWGLIALQGPQAPAILEKLTPVPLRELRYYRFAEAPVAGVLCIISRTGYTGELGFELFVPWAQAESIALALEEAGRPHGLVMCGLGARDSLRLEAGFSLYGHEIDDEITPVQAGLLWTVKLAKSVPFIGRDALLREKTDGPARRVVFFRTGDRRIIRPGTPVLAGGTTVGRVLSGTLSPVCNEAIGSALVDAPAASDGLGVDVRGQRVPLTLCKPPFVTLPKQH